MALLGIFVVYFFRVVLNTEGERGGSNLFYNYYSLLLVCVF